MRTGSTAQPARKLLGLARFVAVLPLLCAVADGDDGDPGLLVNPSFEEPANDTPLPAGWNADRSVYRRDAEVARTGSASLRFDNDEPARYRLANQRVALEPGRTYRFSGWVKDQTAPPLLPRRPKCWYIDLWGCVHGVAFMGLRSARER